MIKINKKSGVLCLLMLCFILLMGDTVMAADSISASIPVKQVFTTSKEVPAELNESCTYELRAKETGYPMPEGSKDGVYQFFLNGNEEKDLGSIVYSHGGVYSYELLQTTADAGSYTYDRIVYQIDVYVKNLANGSLGVQIISRTEDGNKVGEIVFNNSYTGKDPKKKTVKTGDDANLVFLGVVMLMAVLGMTFAVCRKLARKEELK